MIGLSKKYSYNYSSMEPVENSSNAAGPNYSFSSNNSLQNPLIRSTAHTGKNISDVHETSHYSRATDSNFDRRHTVAALIEPEFYKQEGWFEELCEILFKLKRRNATVKAEIYYGIIHFISCLYVLAVVPQQLQKPGYDPRSTVVAVALCSGVGSIVSGLFSNLPFVLAPPTVVSIYLSVFLQQYGLRTDGQAVSVGDIAVISSGACLMFFGWRPLGRLASQLIPLPIQVGTAVGIGLLTSLAGSTEINLVIGGQYTILEIGSPTATIAIAIFGVILISIAMYYHLKGSFCLAVIVCSMLYWMYYNIWPSGFAAIPHVDTATFEDYGRGTRVALLTGDLIFLYILYLSGVMTSLSNLAVLTREDSTVPRGRWIYIWCGIFTMLSGLVCSAPILISPESSASIKAGAKTGLSAVICGILFLISLFFSPIFKEIPAAGTSPVLIMIGIILFQNVGRIDWRNIANAAPAFVVLFYIPFTYSVIQGVLLGYVVYILITLCTGELANSTADFLTFYFPSRAATFDKIRVNMHNTMPGHADDSETAISLAETSISKATFDGADMTMVGPDAAPHFEVRNSENFMDFSTTFRTNRNKEAPATRTSDGTNV